MNRLLTAFAAAALAAATALPAAAEKRTITYAHLLDPSHEAVMWAINNGKVTSDRIEVEATALAIPALIQATISQQYDVVQTAVMGVARAWNKGLKLQVLSTALRSHKEGEGAGIWVKADSPYNSMADLAGKTIGVYALNSTGITWLRIAVWKGEGFDVAYGGGDFEWVEVPAPSLPSALESGRIDAATLIHSQAYKASATGDFRPVLETAPLNYELFGVRPVTAVNVSYPDKLAEDPEAFMEFSRMLKASVDYALAHPDEVFPAVAAEQNLPADFFARWFETYSEFPAEVTDEDVEAMRTVWSLSKELGILDEYPDAEATVWKNALGQ